MEVQHRRNLSQDRVHIHVLEVVRQHQDNHVVVLPQSVVEAEVEVEIVVAVVRGKAEVCRDIGAEVAQEEVVVARDVVVLEAAQGPDRVVEAAAGVVLEEVAVDRGGVEVDREEVAVDLEVEVEVAVDQEEVAVGLEEVEVVLGGVAVDPGVVEVVPGAVEVAQDAVEAVRVTVGVAPCVVEVVPDAVVVVQEKVAVFHERVEAEVARAAAVVAPELIAVAAHVPDRVQEQGLNLGLVHEAVRNHRQNLQRNAHFSVIQKMKRVQQPVSKNAQKSPIQTMKMKKKAPINQLMKLLRVVKSLKMMLAKVPMMKLCP